MDDSAEQSLLAHLDRLHNLARGLTDRPQDAEDLVQETALRAVRSWHADPPRDPAAWLATICLNLARDGARSRAVRPVEVTADGWLDALPASDDPAARAVEHVRARHLHGALARLPAAQREAITLMDLVGFTAAQTAQVLDCPRGTVLARVHRGRKALAALLASEREDHGAPA